jgi:ketosteroid isomerase-like protein
VRLDWYGIRTRFCASVSEHSGKELIVSEQHLPPAAQQFIAALHSLEQGGPDDVDKLVALFNPEAQLTNATLKLANQERTGIAGVRDFWVKYRRMFDTIYSEFDHVTSSAQAIGLFWTSRGMDTQGQPVEYDGASLLVFGEDGKITRFRGYYDTRQISRKVGGAT